MSLLFFFLTPLHFRYWISLINGTLSFPFVTLFISISNLLCVTLNCFSFFNTLMFGRKVYCIITVKMILRKEVIHNIRTNPLAIHCWCCKKQQQYHKKTDIFPHVSFLLWSFWCDMHIWSKKKKRNEIK